MTYEDIINSGTQNYFNNIIANYINSGPKVIVYKYLKDETNINPIYNEEIGSRIYARGFYIPCIYKTNPFVWSFSDTLPSETDDQNLSFIFNFDSLAQTIHGLKQNACRLKITPYNSENWYISKINGVIKLYKPGDDDYILVDTNTYQTLSEVADYLIDTDDFFCFYDDDDYSSCIPDFKEHKINSSVILKTFNSEFKNCTDLVDQGDLIYIPTTNALYEVNASFPVNNIMYKYMNLQCNAHRSFAYVNYERLKAYNWGLNIENADDLKNIAKIKTNNTISANDLIARLCKSADDIGDYNLDYDKERPKAFDKNSEILNDEEIDTAIETAATRASEINDYDDDDDSDYCD